MNETLGAEKLQEGLRLVLAFEREAVNLNTKMRAEEDFDDDHEAFEKARNELLRAIVGAEKEVKHE